MVKIAAQKAQNPINTHFLLNLRSIWHSIYQAIGCKVYHFPGQLWLTKISVLYMYHSAVL